MKEKAKELVDKFDNYAIDVVDEIMKEVDDNPTTNQNEYWNCVKDEINKL